MNEFRVIGTDLSGAVLGEGLLRNVHKPERCEGEWCVIHNPSDHHMRDWPMLWRADRGLMERTCKHGVGHPDPDALAYEIRQGNEWQATHGCDGCCSREENEDGETR